MEVAGFRPAGRREDLDARRVAGVAVVAVAVVAGVARVAVVSGVACIACITGVAIAAGLVDGIAQAEPVGIGRSRRTGSRRCWCKCHSTWARKRAGLRTGLWKRAMHIISTFPPGTNPSVPQITGFAAASNQAMRLSFKPWFKFLPSLGNP